MGYFTLQFENTELEKLYQEQQQKYIKKCAIYYLIILAIGKCLFMIDQLLYSQLILFFINLLSVIVESIIIYFIRRKKVNTFLIQIYLTGICLIATILQFSIYLSKESLNFTKTQQFVWLDIVHQCLILVNYGQSHILSSIIYVIFLISRISIQITYGYTTLSLTFLVYGLFYIIDQYQKAKQRRKQFLKSQKNQLMEKFIQEFIEEQVCILKKDEVQVRLIPIIANSRLVATTNDITTLIKQLRVCTLQETLQNYLYKTLKNGENLLCKIQDQVYEITYQRFLIKKCIIFIKIKKIYQNPDSLVNFKDLYQQYRKTFIRMSQMDQKAKRLAQCVEASMFIYQFQKYYCAYKIQLQELPIKSLLNQFSRKFKIMIFKTNHDSIITDKLLLRLLIKTIGKSISNGQMYVKQFEQGLKLKFVGFITQSITITKKDLIDKILFHIGIGKCVFKENIDRSCQIIIYLSHIESLSFKYR